MYVCMYICRDTIYICVSIISPKTTDAVPTLSLNDNQGNGIQ